MISTSQIQQRLDELNVKEKSLIEERQILTEQLARIRQNQDSQSNGLETDGSSSLKPLVNTKIGTSHLKRSSPSTDESESQVETEILSELSPTSQRVLQQVLNSMPKDNEVVNDSQFRESLRDKVSLLSDDSPNKPNYSTQNNNSTPRRQKQPVNVSSSPTVVASPVQATTTTTTNDGELSESNSPSKSLDDQKLSLAFSHPKFISSLQRLSRRVKIVMKPSGQIFPRQRGTAGTNQNGLFNPDLNSLSPNTTPMTTSMVNENYTSDETNKQTDIFDDNTNDNWLSWDEMV
jgi:hypothetical protein